MALGPGTRLGAYDILSLLGSGGMGEVYRAKDTKLGRDVALKILPDTFTHDPERLARFRREAQVLASLNHPYIGAIYGLEESNGAQFLVLELVDGESLDKRIVRGAIPLDEALAIAKQIAEALEAAHERGIIHRDLKPANIALTKDGNVKVLDFGLAKAVEAPSGAALDLANSPTLTSPAMMTGVGTILGTAAYMSPEQARGRPADKRSDVWAFGCVLYEMLTRKRVVAGETLSDTIAAILEREPDWHALPDATPSSVRHLLRLCLQKDPKRRLHDIADARLELTADDPVEQDANRATARTKTRERVAWTLAVLGLSLAVLAWGWRRSAQPIDAAPHALVRLDVEFGPRVPPGSAGANAILSPDGRRLAFATFGLDGKTHLFARWLDRSNASELAGTEGAYAPFFSPDGQWIGFFADGKLKKIPADGGAATPLCDAPLGRGASWGEDGGIVLTPDLQSRLLRISSSGGNAPVPVTAFGPGEISHRWPQILPGGKAVIFTSLTAANFAAFDEATIQVVSLQNGQRKTLLQGGSYGRYLASGHMLYVRNGTAFAVPFDVDRLETRGTPVPVLEGVANVPNSGAAQLDVSAGGTLVYESGTDQRQTIQWLDATGKLEPLLAKPAFYLWLRFSPDGSRLVYRVIEGASNHLWIYDWQRGTETRLTTDSTIHNSPIWSADGRYIAYQGEGGVFFIAADGAGKSLPLFKTQNSPYPESFSADGRWLAFSAPNPVSGDMDIWTAPLADGGHELRAGTPEPFVHTLALERDAAFSPDGRWLAYTSTESGTYEAYVRAFPGTPFGSGSRWQISNTGGLQPLWSQNGHELFYRSTENRIMVVTYATRGDAFVAEKPRVWAERQVWAAGAGGVLDIAPDGKRFAVLIPAAATGPDAQESRHHVTLVLNFFDELRRLLPVKK